MNISVIIPLYNKKLYIARAINSVLNQTYRDYEIIVIDDGSTDNGPDIFQNIKDDRVKLISQNNSGVSAARNKGIELSTSNMVAFLDADDEWLPDFLEKIIGLRGKYPDAGMYATGFRIIKGEGIYRDIRVRNRQEYYGNYFGLLKQGGAVCASCVAIPKATFSRVGNFRVGYPVGEDLDLWFRIGVYYKVAYSSTVCSLYHYSLTESACNIHKCYKQSPLMLSLAEVDANNQTDKNTRKTATRYVARTEYKNIFRSIVAVRKSLLTESLRKYRNTFGRNSYYWVLSVMLHIPAWIVKNGQRLRLWIVSVFLKSIISIRR